MGADDQALGLQKWGKVYSKILHLNVRTEKSPSRASNLMDLSFFYMFRMKLKFEIKSAYYIFANLV